MTTSKALAHDAAVAITIASTATNAFTAASTAMDNSANLDTDGWLLVKVKSGATGVSSVGLVNVYMLPSTDNGTTYADNTANGAVLLGSMAVIANAITYTKAFRLPPYLPQKFKFTLENQSGAALDATAANHAMLLESYSIQTA